MTERPILFSAPMVRAVLDGSKTQARQVVKPSRTQEWATSDFFKRCQFCEIKGKWLQFEHPGGGPGGCIRVPWVPGDRLWVRETWAPCAAGGPPYYAADYSDVRKELGVTVWRWRPSIHMPRWASRITLEVTGVRVERLQDISEEDARAEGCKLSPSTVEYASRTPYRVQFFNLWESINGPDSWDENPLVWVVEFRKVEVNP